MTSNPTAILPAQLLDYWEYRHVQLWWAGLLSPQVLRAGVSKCLREVGAGNFLFLPASASFTDGVSGWARGGEKCPYNVKKIQTRVNLCIWNLRSVPHL